MGAICRLCPTQRATARIEGGGTLFDLDKLIEKILGTERALSSKVVSTRTYGDEPILQTGAAFRKRYEERKEAEGEEPGKSSTSTHETRGDARMAEREKARAEAREATLTDIHDRVARKRMLRGRFGRRHDVPGQDFPDQPSLLDLPRPSFGDDGSGGPGGFRPLISASNPYQEARDLANDLRRTGARPNRVFYEQAKFMADWEDIIPYHEGFLQSYPSYVSMSTVELPEYISWRTQERKGEAPFAPSGFVLVNAYELLCGIGTTPGEEGYAALCSLRERWGATASVVNSYLTYWIDDYNIYHDLGKEPLAHPGLREFDAAVMTLDRAQRAHLAKLDGLTAIEPPSDAELMGAMLVAGMYHNEKSPFFRAHPEASQAVVAGVFGRLVEHYHKRRKLDLVESNFGEPYKCSYQPFNLAIFYQPTKHPDCSVFLSPAETYTCKDGKWEKTRLWRSYSRSEEIGKVVRAIDREMRKAWDFPSKLGERPTPKYLLAMITKEIEARQERERLEEESRIDIDWSKLEGIRETADDICEALLVDDEREEGASVEVIEPQDTPVLLPAHEQDAPSTTVAQAATTDETLGPDVDDAPIQGCGDFLDGAETRLMLALLDGQPAEKALEPGDPLPSLVIDSINNKFLDLLGDVVIELQDGSPVLVEDYLEDIKEVM